MEGLNIQRVDNPFELVNGLSALGLVLSGVNEITNKCWRQIKW